MFTRLYICSNNNLFKDLYNLSLIYKNVQMKNVDVYDTMFNIPNSNL